MVFVMNIILSGVISLAMNITVLDLNSIFVTDKHFKILNIFQVLENQVI